MPARVLRSRSKKSKKREDRKFQLAKGQPDIVMIILVIIFLVFGLIMVFDASLYQADTVFDDKFYFVKQQVVWIVLGIAAGAVMYVVDYRKYQKLIVPAMIGVIVLLVAVLVLPSRAPGEACAMFCVREVNGARRWLVVAGIPIQPAELAKPAFIIYLSLWLARTRKDFKSLKEAVRHHFIYDLMVFLLMLGVIGGLILFEPDLGTTAIICIVAFAIYFTSGQDMVHTMGSGLIVVVGGLLGTAAMIVEGYRLERVQTFIDLLIKGEVADPLGAGYQIQQILIGIGSGGPRGVGFGESRQRFGYLVENTAFTDSISAIILEEMGMIGGVILVLMFLLFLVLTYRIAVRAPDRLGQLLAGGIGFWLVLQAFLHMAANVALVPVTGIPLTFFSYGGSSMIVALMGVGILLNISRFAKEDS